MSFHKKFVRVEALAIARAIALQKEAGCDDLYLALSQLMSEKGLAQEIANSGGKLFDRDGNFVCARELKPDEMGLGEEIGSFAFTPADDCGNREPNGSELFLERHYHIAFNDPKTHQQALWVSVVFAKKTKDSDWILLTETASKSDGNGAFFRTGMVIAREYQEIPA